MFLCTQGYNSLGDPTRQHKSLCCLVESPRELYSSDGWSGFSRNDKDKALL